MTPGEMTTLQHYFDNALRVQSESNERSHDRILEAIQRLEDTGEVRSVEISSINERLATGQVLFIDRDKCDATTIISNNRIKALEDIETNRKGKLWMLGIGLSAFIILAQIGLPRILEKLGW